MKVIVSLAGIAAALAASLAHGDAPSVSTTPAQPTYGQDVTINVTSRGLIHRTATRYTVAGNTITVDYDYTNNGWLTSNPAYGAYPLVVGELPAGNYTLTAQLHDMDNPTASPLVATTILSVSPPAAVGIYSVPDVPDAFTPISAMLRSDFYYDASSMRASVSGSVIRVAFDFYANAPASGPAPAGSTTYGSVPIPGLAPGQYRIEAWGSPKLVGFASKAAGGGQMFYTSNITVATSSPVVEYYASATGHYFMSAGAGDIALLDAGTLGWERSGQQFYAWVRQADAPPGAMPVCRFYAAGPNSHFYTADPGECQGLKDLEQSQRAQAAAAGQPFLGWAYEQIAFYALTPVNGQCPADTIPVYRAYNQRAAQNDANRRFVTDPTMLDAEVDDGWSYEGIVFCSPG